MSQDANYPPYVQVAIDPRTGQPELQSNISDPFLVLRLTTLGLLRTIDVLAQNSQIVPRKAIVLPDGSPAPASTAAAPPTPRQGG